MGSRATIGALVGLLVWLLPSPAAAAPGDLDPSFGRAGLARLLPEARVLRDFASFPDGGVVAAFSQASPYAGGVLRKLGPDGRPDDGFGDGGSTVRPPIDVAGLDVYPDGAVALVGLEGAMPGDERAVARLRPDGSADPAFADGGVARPDFGPQFRLAGVIANSDGGLTTAVRLGGGIGGETAIARFGPDGSLDDTFGQSGLASPVSGSFVDLEAGPAGTTYLLVDASPDDALSMVARFDHGGALDPSFGAGGIAYITDPYGQPSGYTGGLDEIEVDGAGRTVTVGSYLQRFPGKGDGGSRPVSRLLADGSPDAGFDTGRSFVLRGGYGRFLTLGDVSVDERDRVLISGWAGLDRYDSFPPQDAAVARLRNDGSLDPRFGENGVSAFPSTYSDFPIDGFQEVEAAAGGRIVASGFGMVARLKNVAGRADADADGVVDRRDGCARRFAKRRDGCTRLPVEVEIGRFSQRRAVGEVEAPPPCL